MLLNKLLIIVVSLYITPVRDKTTGALLPTIQSSMSIQNIQAVPSQVLVEF